MPLSLRILYATRRFSFIAVTLIMTTVLWLLFMDLVMRNPVGSIMIEYLRQWYGYYFMFDHGIRGMMGIYPASLSAHWIFTIVGLTTFFGSQLFFLLPRRDWTADLLRHKQMSLLSCGMAAVPSAVLTVGFVAMIAEACGYWSSLPAVTEYRSGFRILPSAHSSVPVLIVSWVFWFVFIRAHKKWGDRLLQRAILLYYLFVVAGLQLLISGVLQVIFRGFDSTFWDYGTYTAMGTSLSVMLWTLIPGLALIYQLRSYQEDPGLFAKLINPPESQVA